MLTRVEPNDENPGVWDFTPKGKTEHYLMVNLGAGVSISHAKACKLYERWNVAGSMPHPLMTVLEDAYNMKKDNAFGW